MPSKAIDCYKSVTGDVGGICLHPDRCCFLGSGVRPGDVYSEDTYLKLVDVVTVADVSD